MSLHHDCQDAPADGQRRYPRWLDQQPRWLDVVKWPLTCGTPFFPHTPLFFGVVTPFPLLLSKPHGVWGWTDRYFPLPKPPLLGLEYPHQVCCNFCKACGMNRIESNYLTCAEMSSVVILQFVSLRQPGANKGFKSKPVLTLHLQMLK